jgi:hypothetical protein
MKIYAHNDLNLPVSLRDRPQLERFFYDGNIYVIENTADYASLPAPILNLLNGRTAAAFLKSQSYYTMFYKALQAKVFLHPETDLRTFSFEANGTTASGTSATVGNPGHVYVDSGVIVAKINPTDAKTSSSYRAEILYPKHYADKFQYDVAYNIGFGLKIAQWDAVTNPKARMVVFQVHQTEDPGDYSGTPILGLSILGPNLRFCYARDERPITTGIVPEITMFEIPATTDTWIYFGLRVIFNYEGKGHLAVYVNGNLMGRYDGSLGYNDALGPYVKMGCYEGSNDGFQAGTVSREIHYKGLVVIEEKAGYSLEDTYTDLQAV